MGTNAKQFNDALKRHSRVEIPAASLLQQKKTAIEVLSRVVDKTPVKTGRARGGWTVTTNAPASGQTDRIDKPGQTTIGDGISKMSTAIPFGTIYVTNNVQYIVPLENGHSGQSPNGMVAVTLAEINA